MGAGESIQGGVIRRRELKPKRGGALEYCEQGVKSVWEIDLMELVVMMRWEE